MVRPAELIGREPLLAELDGLLDRPGARPRLVVLHGLGGVGKTSLAVETAHRRLSGYGLAWQFSAEDPTVLSAGFADLATLLGLREIGDSGDPVAQVHGALAERDGRWLLVFDNVPDFEAVEHVLPATGDGDVLVTSRSAAWPRSLGIEVTVLDPHEGRTLLMTRTGDDDLAAARDVATELGGLPLALEQAGAYMSETGMTNRDYLRLLSRRRAELLTRGRAFGHHDPVATTWNVIFERLRDSQPHALTVLRLLACLAPDAIPVMLLMSGPDALPDGDVTGLYGDELAVTDAIAALRRYSLISSPTGGVVSVHRLVQAVILDQLPVDVRRHWQETAAGLVEAALPDEPEQMDTWPTYALLLPHCRTALSAVAPGMAKLVRYLGASGDYRTAAAVQQEIHEDAAIRVGPDHPDALTAQADLAKWIGHADDPLKARDMFVEILQARTRLSGPDHPATLAVREALADWTGQSGNPDAAREMCLELLPIRSRVSGPEADETLRLAQEVGFWTGQSGDPAAARKMYEEVLPKMARSWGPEHPETLTARAQHGRFVGESGDPEAARDIYEELTAAYQQVAGSEHPDALWGLDGLAWWTGAAGDPATAQARYTELLQLRARISGPDHHATLVAWANLAWWTGQAGDPATARDLITELLPVRERKFGRDHYDSLVARRALAHWTRQAGDATAAVEQLTALLPILERIFGSNYWLTKEVQVELAAWAAQLPPRF